MGEVRERPSRPLLAFNRGCERQGHIVEPSPLAEHRTSMLMPFMCTAARTDLRSLTATGGEEARNAS